MKYLTRVAVEVKFVRIVVEVRYDDEDIPYDFPFRTGDTWDVTVELETGKILDWPGPAAEVCMKVCDCGSYYLLDEQKSTIAKIENDYVPHGVVPGEYGDYIDLKIASDGTIENWNKEFEFSDFR